MTDRSYIYTVSFGEDNKPKVKRHAVARATHLYVFLEEPAGTELGCRTRLKNDSSIHWSAVEALEATENALRSQMEFHRERMEEKGKRFQALGIAIGKARREAHD